MAQITFDLSGAPGLAPNFYGDKPYSSSKPNLRYLGSEGQLAEGIFNPISNMGYMSPVNDTTKAISGTTSFLLSSSISIPQRIAEETTNVIFFGDEANTGTSGQVVNLDTTIDTSLDSTVTLTGILNPLFIFDVSDQTSGWSLGFVAKPSGSTVPVLNTWAKDETAGSSTTQTFSFTVPAGLTDSTIVVIAYGKGITNASASITWNGTALTSSGGGYSAGSVDSGVQISYLAAPVNATGNVVVTWDAARTDMVAYALLFTGVLQTSPITGLNMVSFDTATQTVAIVPVGTADNQLKVLSVITNTTSIIEPNFFGYTQINKEEDAGAGTHALYTYAYNTQTFYVSDMITYTRNGAPKIFFGKKNSLGTNPINDIGMAEIDFSNLHLNWLSEEATGGSSKILNPKGNIIFVLADNGLLYVLNGNKIHYIDGLVTGGILGTVTSNVLQFLGTESNPVTYIQDGVDIRGKMWVGIHVDSYFDTNVTSISTKSIPMFVGVYVWDRISSMAGMQDFIEIKGVREFKSIHNFNNVPACFTISTDGYTQFRVWNGAEFEVVKTLGKNSYPVYRRHSVYEDGSKIWWLGNDGKIYMYGKLQEGLGDALYIMGDMSGHVTSGQTYSGSGVLVPANATETVTSGNNAETLAFYVSFKDTGGNHLKKWYPFGVNSIATVAQTGNVGNVYSLVKYLPTLSTVRECVIRCIPTGTGIGTIATVKYYFNQSSTVGMTKTITKDEASKGYVEHKINKSNINSIQIEIEWSTTETLGSDTFTPSFAIVNYQSTDGSSPDNG